MVDLVPAAVASSITSPDVLLNEARHVGLWDACRDLLDHKWLIIFMSLLCCIAGASYALLATPWYKAEVDMIPVEQKPALAGLGQIGGLASLAGIDLGDKGNAESMAVLQSRTFAAEFIAAKHLVPAFFADEWDGPHNRWKAADPEKQPDIRKAVEYFNEKVRTVGEDRKSGVVTIFVLWKDASVAAEWANELATLINAQLRKRALEDAERNVQYLQKEISATNVVSLQQSIGRLLESEMQKLMMARGREEYAFRIVDKAVPPVKRFRPQRVLIIAMSTLLGAMLSIGFVLLRRSVVADSV